MCTSGSTCCKLSTGQYGCCPLPEAVCCSDGKHCCPNGYTCIPGACTGGGSSEVTDWVEKQPALLRSENLVCPDGQHECKTGQTCCKLASGGYACCSVPNKNIEIKKIYEEKEPALKRRPTKIIPKIKL